MTGLSPAASAGCDARRPQPIRLAAATYYEVTAPPRARAPALDRAIRCEVCVVGGGLLGLSAALHLARAGRDVVLLEAESVGAGASGRNGGLVLPGFATAPEDVIAVLGRDDARRLWDRSVEGVALAVRLARDHAPDAALTPGGIVAATTAAGAAELERLAQRLAHDFGYAHLRVLDRAAIAAAVGTEVYRGGLIDSGAWHVQPLALVRGLASACERAGVRIFEGTRVRALERGEPAQVRAGQGSVAARHVVLALNAAAGKLARPLSRPIVPIRTYMVATERLPDDRLRSVLPGREGVYDSGASIDYFRVSPDGRVLFGSAAAALSWTRVQATRAILRRVARLWPDLRHLGADFVWDGVIDLTLNNLIHAGRDENLWFAQGFNGHGLALTLRVGQAIAEAIDGRDQDFALFARVPHRAVPLGPAFARWLMLAGRAWWHCGELLRR